MLPHTAAAIDLSRFPLAARADQYAEAVHGALRHTRKYSGAPYITHPRAVAAIVAAVLPAEDPQTDAALAAALLHDVLEMSNRTKADLERHFGGAVADMVEWLTDETLGETLRARRAPRRERLAASNARLARAPQVVKTIKLGDILHNTESIVEVAPKFAAFYVLEKWASLEALKGGHPALWDRARAQLQEADRATRAQPA